MRRIEGFKLKDLRQKFPDLKGIAESGLCVETAPPSQIDYAKIQAASRKSAGKNVHYSRQVKTNVQISGASAGNNGRRAFASLPALRHKSIMLAVRCRSRIVRTPAKFKRRSIRLPTPGISERLAMT
jgi:hypothetical protein